MHIRALLEEQFRSAHPSGDNDRVVPAEVLVGLSASEAVPFPGLTGLADMRTAEHPTHPIHSLQQPVSTPVCSLL